MNRTTLVVAALALACGGTVHAAGGNVKITPLGSHDGEFCRNDRALIFEDPDGTRILYDAGPLDLFDGSSLHFRFPSRA